MENLFLNDTNFGKKFSVISLNIYLKGYGGKGRVHPDLIPSPLSSGKVLMVYTPENPNAYENMCLVTSPQNDLINWSDKYWKNPLISRNWQIKWKDYHLGDFCLLYVPELRPKWWSWYQPHSSTLGCQIALAISRDGFNWSDKIKGNPVMRSRDNGNNWEYDYLRAPSVLWNRATKKFEMFYDNLISDWSKPIRICRAESIDGINWINRAIIFDPLKVQQKFHAFHPVVRYFAGYYWCWFPRYNEGIWLMYSKTGLPDDWSHPDPVITPGEVGANGLYRAGVFIDNDYTIHLMLSAIHANNLFKIHYLRSNLSVAGQKQLKRENIQINDYDYGGSIINNNTKMLLRKR